MRSCLVKTFGIVAMVGLLTSVADAAQSRKHRRHVAAPSTMTVTPLQRGANLFPAGPIYYGTEYLGTDPDPFIRQQIWRDLGAHFGGAF